MYLKQCYVVPLSVPLFLIMKPPSRRSISENTQVFNFSIQFNWKPGGGIPFFNPFKPIHPLQASLVFHTGHKATEGYSAVYLGVFGCISVDFSAVQCMTGDGGVGSELGSRQFGHFSAVYQG